MRQRRRPLSHINVIPYIDVMLVLLVAFVITAPLLKSGVEVDLPQAPAKPIGQSDTEPPPTLVVSMTRQGELTVAMASGDGAPVSRIELQRRVRSALTEMPNLAVFLRADQALPYGRVIDVMTVLQQAGADKVGLITEPLLSGTDVDAG